MNVLAKTTKLVVSHWDSDLKTGMELETRVELRGLFKGAGSSSGYIV